MIRKSLSFPGLTLSAAILLGLGSSASAQTWTGAVSNDFSNNSNWSSALGTNQTLQINGPGTQGNSTLINGGYTFSGTGGKLNFGASSGNMSLTGGAITIFNGTVDAIRTEVSAGNTTTINNNVVLGDSAAGTISFSSGGGGAATLRVNGDITGGTGGTAGALVLSLGSTGTFNGAYMLTGNISRGGATTIAITSRGVGAKELSGINTFNGGLNYGTTTADLGASFRITGGTTNITVADGTSGWGTGNQTNTFRVSGGVVNTTSGRSIDPSIIIDGGTMNVNVGASRMSFASANTTLTVSSGALNVGAVTNGVRFGTSSGNAPTQTGAVSFTANQTGGTVTVVGAGGPTTTFGLGGNDTTSTTVIAYNLSGGTLDVGNSTSNTNGYIQLGANANGNGTTTLALSGTGKLISRSVPTTTNGGISGAQVGGVQVLSLTGGTLAAGRIDAANLRGSAGDANGTVINNGATIAPGDTTFAGRTAIAGNLTINSGTFNANLGGTTASSTSVWQDTTTGRYDVLTATGAISLGGNLEVSFINSFAPNIGNSFTIISSTGALSGTFANAASAYVVQNVNGNNYDFLVAYNSNSVVLTLDAITAIPEPSTYALAVLGLLGLLVVARKRRATS